MVTWVPKWGPTWEQCIEFGWKDHLYVNKSSFSRFSARKKYVTQIIQSLAATAKVEIWKRETEIWEPCTHACRVKVDERGQQGCSSHPWSGQQKVDRGGHLLCACVSDIFLKHKFSSWCSLHTSWLIKAWRALYNLSPTIPCVSQLCVLRIS